jgi:NADPH:quinone reductase-like Zn-dependent oxidoreductase
VRGGDDDEAVSRVAAGRVRVARVLVEPDRTGMEAIASLVESGQLRPRISATYPLSDAARAHAEAEAGHALGKRVLTVD